MSKKEYQKQYRLNNLERLKDHNKNWLKKNPDYKKNYERMRRKADLIYRLSQYTRNKINRSFKRKMIRKDCKTKDILGCSFSEFKKHLESKFKEGMTWENRSAWHIDHIIPLSSAKNKDEFIRLNHYTNLQPLWAADNMRKHTSLTWK